MLNKNRRSIFDAFILGIISYLAARLAVYFLIRPEGMAPFWFANGVVLATLLRRSRKEWPLLLSAVFAGFFINMTLSGFPLYPDAIYGLVNIIEPTIAAVLIQKFIPRFVPRTLRSLAHLIASSFLACAIGATIAWIVGPIKWQLWWIDDWLGILLVTPVLLIFWPPQNKYPVFSRPTVKQVIEMVTLLLGMGFFLSVLYFQFSGSSPLVYSYVVLPFLLWATLRFRTKGATVASLFLAFLTIGFTIYGVGPFAATSELIDRSLLVQVFLALVMLSHLSLGVALAERAHISDVNEKQITILESVGKGAPLKTILERIVYFVEGQEDGLLCSILLLDAKNKCVRHGASPTLPREFTNAIDGSKIGPTAGSCGASAYTGKRVIIDDIERHPNWVDYKHLAIPHGLRACWSSPIFSPSKEVLGTFAIYYKEPRSPSEHEVYWVDVATHLASVAIERDRNEEEIKKNETRLRNLFETTHEGIWMMDKDGKTTYLNPRMQEVIGYSSHELVGKKALDYVYEEDKTLAEEKLARRIQGQSEQHEIRLVHKDGSVRWVIIAGSPIFDREGVVEGILGMVTDITERKNIEKQMLSAQRLESLGTLAGGIAHDFNNILTAIMGNVSLIRNFSLEQKVQEKLSTIQAASVRGADLVQQILTFSKPVSTGRATIQLQTVADEAIKLLKSTVPAMIQIKTHWEPGAHKIFADMSQIHQVIMNLGTNGIHALAGRGFLEFRIDDVNLDNALVGVATEIPPGKYVRLRVSDNGCGMSPQTVARIFDPFFTTKSPSRGTGLGLSVVLGIVKSHAGAIRVRTAPETGTTFSVYFPVATKESSDIASKDEGKILRGNGQRVLYVDDEIFITELVTNLLDDLGYRVTGLTNSEAALEAIKRDSELYDMIITDYEMPALSGLDLLQEIRRFNYEIPAILVSGIVTSTLAERAKKIGVQKTLVKPNFIYDLPAAIGEILRQKTKPS